MLDLNEISYAELLDCIEDAKAGQLSPYWQGYAQRELASLRRPDGTLPPRAEALRRQLQQFLQEVPQCPDEPGTAPQTQS